MAQLPQEKAAVIVKVNFFDFLWLNYLKLETNWIVLKYQLTEW